MLTSLYRRTGIGPVPNRGQNLCKTEETVGANPISAAVILQRKGFTMEQFESFKAFFRAIEAREQRFNTLLEAAVIEVYSGGAKVEKLVDLLNNNRVNPVNVVFDAVRDHGWRCSIAIRGGAVHIAVGMNKRKAIRNVILATNMFYHDNDKKVPAVIDRMYSVMKTLSACKFA